MDPTTPARHWMLQAVELARSSVAEPHRMGVAPSVGAVIVKGGQTVATGFRGELGEGDHAERCALQKLADDASGGRLFTTLEPCTDRKPPKVPCAERIRAAGIEVVYIGMYDPNPPINRVGWKYLVDAGIVVRDFDDDVRQQIEELNADFIGQYRAGHGDSGRATFDYLAAGHKFPVQTDSFGVFVTGWSKRGPGGIYALNYDDHPALAKNVTNFEQVDDAAVFDFGHYSAAADAGEVVVFQNDRGYLLVSILDVKTDPHTEMTIEWQARAPGRASAAIDGE